MLSLFGRDTQHAFGHLGFANILSWTNPLYGLTQRITSEAPKVPESEMIVWDPSTRKG